MANATSSAETRDRILTATNELFRQQGFHATSVSQVVAAASATTGSVYHFFPGGKDELTAEVLRTSGHAYGELVAGLIRAAPDPAAGMRDAFAGAGQVLAESGYFDLCPIGTVAREVATTNDALRQVASAVMTAWSDELAAVFEEAGIEPDRAVSLATLCIASIEGGFILARTHREVSGWLSIGESLAVAIEAELPGR